MMPTAFLHEIDGGGSVRASHPIEKLVCSIGTDKHSDIRLRGRGVAPVHAQVRVGADGVRIEAVGGERLVVNGKRTDSRSLQPGDVVDLGAVRLRFDMKIKETREETGPTAAATGSLKAMLGSAARFSEALAGTYQVDELLATMLDEMIEITDAARGAVLLLVDGKPQQRAAREAGRKPTRGEFPISDTIVARVCATKMPEIVRDALNDTVFSAARSVLDFKLASVLCVPLMVRGELLGVIYLGNDNVVNLFTREALDIATV
ncbi:MAG: GAF domain-containing protein, partial [Deltaproteobacteria bacterium]|nr:GAF domain-containing protein [Deltaproteobacteria bacterium]